MQIKVYKIDKNGTFAARVKPGELKFESGKTYEVKVSATSEIKMVVEPVEEIENEKENKQ